MNNPIIVFKCDVKHIREKFFFADLKKPKVAEKKKDFFKMSEGFVPLFESDVKKMEKNKALEEKEDIHLEFGLILLKFFN